MKKTILFLTLLGAIVSCSKEDEEKIQSTVSNTYKLIEVLADPGDGSGTFQPVNSTKTIELLPNGNVVSNGDICSMSANASPATSGTYSYTDSTITTSDCKINFSLTGNKLILTYPCIEPCQAKYRKL